MTWCQLILNNPQWIGVIANTLFAAITVVAIGWQVIVMRRQARILEWQSRVIRLQHEHDWILRLNSERQSVLVSLRDLNLCVLSLTSLEETKADAILWQNLKDALFGLDERFGILQVGVDMGQYDSWYLALEEYIAELKRLVLSDSKTNEAYGMSDEVPNRSTRESLALATQRLNPTNIILGIEAAIRMELQEFRDNWSKLSTSLVA